MREEIDRLKPDIILVFLGTPKQDHSIECASTGDSSSVIVAAGAVVDFFGGRVKIAPAWITASASSGYTVCSAKTSAGCGNGTPTADLAFVLAFLLQLTGLRRYPLERGAVGSPVSGIQVRGRLSISRPPCLACWSARR